MVESTNCIKVYVNPICCCWILRTGLLAVVKWPVHCNRDEVMPSNDMKMGFVFGPKLHLHKIQWIHLHPQG
jgi:hypothetical protein